MDYAHNYRHPTQLNGNMHTTPHDSAASYVYIPEYPPLPQPAAPLQRAPQQNVQYYSHQQPSTQMTTRSYSQMLRKHSCVQYYKMKANAGRSFTGM